MNRRLAQTVGSLTALLAAVTSPATADQSLRGYWMDSDGEVILEIDPCGDAMCGKVAWLRLPNGPDGKPILDYRNPDESLRARPVCGLQVLTGMKKQEDGTFGGGRVYVSDLGMEFKGNAKQLDNDHMEVRGYIGISLFGQSEVWKRVAGPPEHCAKPKPAAAPLVAVPPAAANAVQPELTKTEAAKNTEPEKPVASRPPKPAAAQVLPPPKPPKADASEAKTSKAAAPQAKPAKPQAPAKPPKPAKPETLPWNTSIEPAAPGAQ